MPGFFLKSKMCCLIIFAGIFFLSCENPTRPKMITVGLIHNEIIGQMTDEEKAAIEFLKQNEQLSLKAFTFDQLSETTQILDGIDVLWFHRVDTSRVPVINKEPHIPVSYTHLTLPTNREV